ncbi:M20/M25/M40 family metallo-hydrolase [Croceicoccus marinus]|uniref:Peptidase M28 n=1 Tax=Croceicoccus marinus TaxID=450378 RepID=A0A1Z1FBG8_9SPHN|nr:M20/M25/M40 family metallo-hydrolase [Croceicoccus marinus]ARU16094.1 peptidase M28 [Croceicoccus marinus]
MNTRLTLAALLALASNPILSTPASAQSEADIDVSEERLRADIDTLVGFGTRNTLSVQNHPTRGIGAARRWAEAEFRRISQECGGCLEIALPERIIQGRRVAEPTRLVNVLAVQPGTERPDEVVIVSAHIDSMASDPTDAVTDAPGANDDGSGTALIFEAARNLSRFKFPTTIVYAVLSGEEQGLYGGKLLADYAEEQGWTVKAVLNNDIVGGTHGSDGYVDNEHIRVFSEAVRADAGDDQRADMRRNGGENDAPSRNLSRWLANLSESDADDALSVRQVWRADRMGRGGDHLPMLEKGFPAVRLSVAVEDYEHQHQNVRTEDGVFYGDVPSEMDFPYLARVTRLNTLALARLAQTPMPPRVTADAAVRPDTLVEWQESDGAARYALFRRRTDDAAWERVREVPAGTTSDTLELRGDDWIVGVSAIAASGAESPVAAAVPGGAFYPLANSE